MSTFGDILKVLKKSWKLITFMIVVVSLLPLPILIENKASRCAYVLLVMSIFWATNVVPISMTAIFPVILFPYFGVLTSKEVSQQYMTNTSMLFIGGLFFAIALEVCNFHTRISLKLILILGTSFSRMLLGFMITTCLLSLWINNTASTAMMIPIADSVIKELYGQDEKIQKSSSFTMVNAESEPTPYELFVKKRKISLFLSIAASANIGGIGILTGTGTNLVFKGITEEIFPKYEYINFGTWFMYNMPGTILRIAFCYAFFHIYYIVLDKNKDFEENEEDKNSIKNKIKANYDALGPINFHQIAILSLLCIVILIWFFRQETFIPGWVTLFPRNYDISDTTVAMTVGIFLFLIPKDINTPFGKSLVEWKDATNKIPWGIIFILGGGFALAEGCKKTGLTIWVAEQLDSLHKFPPIVIQCSLGLFATVITQFISNAAAATMLLPSIAEIAVLSKIHPMYYMLPVTICCSFAFMLPAGTAPNVIVFEAAEMRTVDMIKPGFFVCLICLCTEGAIFNTLGVFMLDLYKFPTWAERT